MPAPVFVTFTSALTATLGLSASASIRISTQAPIVGLTPVVPGTLGTDGSLSAVTMVRYAGGAADFVSGSVATTASALGVAATQPYYLANIPIGSVAYGSLGTDAVSVSGTQYYSEGWNPSDRLVTNIAVLN